MVVVMALEYRKKLSTWVVMWAILAVFAAHADAADVDLEIVLAVDASGSVSPSEFELQMGGIAAAFRDPSIQQAIVSGPRGKVAVALLIWSDAALRKYQSEWHVLAAPDDAGRFASVIEGFRERSAGGTSIGDAVGHAIGMIDGNGISAQRRVIDVSGDGVETTPWFAPAMELPEARKLATSRKITINGLAIVNDIPFLDRWYRANVATGPGSFVITAADYDDFKRAIREKLWREFLIVIGQSSAGQAVSFELRGVQKRDPLGALEATAENCHGSRSHGAENTIRC
jgi:hypothetical protein